MNNEHLRETLHKHRQWLNDPGLWDLEDRWDGGWLVDGRPITNVEMWELMHREHDMKISEEFGGSYLKAADLKGKQVRVIIDNVSRELFRDDKGGEAQKLVVWFRGKEKGLVLNKTNAESIAAMHGDDTDDWTGREIRLYAANVQAFGEMMKAIRIVDEVPAEEAAEDEIPF